MNFSSIQKSPALSYDTEPPPQSHAHYRTDITSGTKIRSKGDREIWLTGYNKAADYTPNNFYVDRQLTQPYAANSDTGTISDIHPHCIPQNIHLQTPITGADYTSRRSVTNQASPVYPNPALDPPLGAAQVGGSGLDRTICYGVLKNLDVISVEGDVRTDEFTAWNFDNLSLCFKDGSNVPFSNRAATILKSLRDQAGVSFDFLLTSIDENGTNVYTCGQKRPRDTTELAVSTVLYGPVDDADDIGEWLGSMKLWLQTPSRCSLNVPYHNPHKMLDTCAPTMMTGQLCNERTKIERATVREADLITGLFTTRVFPHASQPARLRSKLHPHQLEALTFMQYRECGWDVENVRCTNDLWQCKLDSFARKKYVEALSGRSSFKPPPEFRGGILADEMGLGKTCTILALIAADTAPPPSSALVAKNKVVKSATPSRQQTLIIVPLSLLQVWENQISQHFQPNTVRRATHYGTRKKLHEGLRGVDIVLTTYEMVSQEWRSAKRKTQSSGHLSSIHWHRIILDEAHKIKNKCADITKAVTALTADCRWCVTGTPIQNRSSDLFALLRFLRVHPYDDPKVFEEVFVKAWKNVEASALLKLQRLMSVLAIRRPQAVVALPPKYESSIPVVLSVNERSNYDDVKRGVVEVLGEATEPCRTSKVAYLTALQRINQLRYVCNHGKAPKSKGEVGNSFDSKIDNSISLELSALFGYDDADLCSSCNQPIQAVKRTQLSPVSTPTSSQGTGTCSRCESFTTSFTDHLLPPERLSRSTSRGSDQANSSRSSSAHADFVPSKVCAIADEIQRTPASEKCAILSFWTTTLDVISQNPTRLSIPHIRYDGAMSRTKRDQALVSFISKPASSCKAILVSITCGGQGLDLTVANHAFIVEPQWNPTLEEQAMSRVYRLGQDKPVQLRRFVVQDTFEQRIVDLQGRKRKLAELIVDQRGLHRGEEDHGDDASDTETLRNRSVDETEETKKLLWWLRDLVT